jgi:cell fate regulator YaaT (PSP1 superfamily)
VADVVGVVFRNRSKIYHFDPAGLELSRGDRIVVQTMQGIEIGQVVEPPHVVEDSDLPAPLKKVVRAATEEDLKTQAEAESVRKEAMIKCRELIETHGLDMKLVDAEVSFGSDKITFSFYSDDRVDFRGLVADLARTLKLRIELRQIGAREEARMVGGLGPCGRGLCCTMFPGDEDPVSIRMAKEQNLPLNPMKISGLCGRLMCCLKYEQEQYVTFRKEAPPKGTPVQMGDLGGGIIGYNVLKDAVVVRFEDGSISDVRLGGCERDEHGCLHCAREEEKPDIQEFGSLSFTPPAGNLQRALVEVEDSGEAQPAAPSGETAGVAAGEVEQAGEGRSRSRRSRGRRGGRGRGPGGAAGGETEGGSREGAAGGAGSGAKEGQPGGRSPRRGQGQGSARSGEGAAEGTAEGRRPASTEGGTGEGGEGGARRPRRRRRSRRRGSGTGEGGGGEAGNGGGSPGPEA